MSNFSAFFATGKRVTFSLSYCGREVVSFDSDDYDIANNHGLGCQLTKLVPMIDNKFSDLCKEEDIGLQIRRIFAALISSYDMAEYPTIEIFSLLSIFTLMINRSR